MKNILLILFIGAIVSQIDIFATITGYIIFSIIFILIVSALYAIFRCKGKRCPKCNSCAKKFTSKELVEQHYKYETKSGQPNKRYKLNPIISTYRYFYECPNKECRQLYRVDRVENPEE